MVGTVDFQGYPSILEPQLKSDPRAGIVLDSTSEGLVVSLDYGSTIIISVVAGQLQVGQGFLGIIQRFQRLLDDFYQHLRDENKA